MLDRFLSYFAHDLGIDLGTANTLIYVRGKGVLVKEPTVVARHRKTKQILSMGTEAKKMLGKTPAMIEAIRPIVNGVIGDLDATETMLSSYIREVHTEGRVLPRIARPRVVVNIPSGVTDVERRAVQDVILRAGARSVFMVEGPMLTALGSGLPVEESSGAFVVDIGAGRTEMAVIALGGIVLHRSIKIAGEEMDKAIINYLRLKHSLLLGEQTAEEVKLSIGSAWEPSKKFRGDGASVRNDRFAVVRGRDLETGLPVSVKITESEVREAITPVVREIINTIQDLLEETPPELVSDVLGRGIVLSGGGALLKGLDKMIAEEARLPVWVTDDPLTCMVRGCGKMWENEIFLRKVMVLGGRR